MKHILFCGDGSAEAGAAEAAALALIDAGDSIVALYVIANDLIHYGEIDQLATPADKEHFIAYIREQGAAECQQHLGAFAQKAEQRGAVVELRVRWGNAAQAIINTAAATQAQGIVLAARAWGIDWHEPAMKHLLEKSCSAALTLV
jgi:nucleotide-binding universal stress UspA family protein